MTPWGFKRYRGRGLVAVRSVKERAEHERLGQTAILLCTQMGFSADHLEVLAVALEGSEPIEDSVEDVKVPLPDLVATLRKLQKEGIHVPKEAAEAQ